MEAKVEIDLDGHTACIEEVYGQLANARQPNNEILVALSFKQPVGGWPSFTLHLPLREYQDKGELLSHIIQESKKRVVEILVSSEAYRIRQEEQDARQMKLDQKVEEFKAMIGLG